MTETVNVDVFVCCDKIIEEAGNGKKTIIGTFRNFNFVSLPAPLGAPWFVFASLSRLDTGDHTITVNIAHDQTQGVVFAASLEIQEDHPENVDLVIPAHGTVFQKEGKHVVSLNIDGTQVKHYVLTVALARQPVGGT